MSAAAAPHSTSPKVHAPLHSGQSGAAHHCEWRVAASHFEQRVPALHLADLRDVVGVPVVSPWCSVSEHWPL